MAHLTSITTCKPARAQLACAIADFLHGIISPPPPPVICDGLCTNPFEPLADFIDAKAGC